MNLEEAMKIIEDVCAAFNGPLQSHQTIQQALIVIKSALGAAKIEGAKEDEKSED